MSWFWFAVAILMLAWNVALMRMLNIAQHDIRDLKRRLHNQGITLLTSVLGRGL